MSELTQSIDTLFEYLVQNTSNLATPWTGYQALIVFACILIAIAAARLVSPRLEDRIRRLQKQPTLMRLLVIPLRRLHWIFAAAILLVAALVMREITWPSRSFFVMLAAQLLGAWVLISIASRLVRNRELSRTVEIVGWIVATLAILALLDDMAAILDSVGFTIGDRRVSLLLVAKGLAIFGFLVWLSSVIGSFTENRLKSATDITPTFQVLISKIVKAILITLAVMLSLTAVGIDLTALAVFSGALGLGIGFGLQKVASNLISGVIILVDRSIKPGDVISLGETFGWISQLQSRYVSVVTRDGVEHLIPNETFISEPVINWSHSNKRIRLEIKFGTSYENDPHITRSVAVEAVSQLDRVLENPRAVCHITGFGDSSVDFVLRFWVDDPQNGVTNISGLAYLAVWDAFKEHDVSIPFPHREIRFQTPLTMIGESKRAGDD